MDGSQLSRPATGARLGRLYRIVRHQPWLYDQKHDSMRAGWRRLTHSLLRVACRVSAARYSITRKQWATRGRMLLNLGSGRSRLPGWVNVDINPFSRAEAWIDLRDRWPFQSQNADGVYSRHSLEHFKESDVLHILDESQRVLKPGGGIRIGVPCLETALRLYEEGGFPDWVTCRAKSPGRRFFSYIMANGNHQVIFDYTYLAELLELTGFERIERLASGTSHFLEQSLLEVVETTSDHGTLYVEAFKPSR